MARQEPPVLKVHRVVLVSPVLLEQQVHRVQLVSRVHKDRRVLLEQQAPQGLSVPQDLQGHRVQLVNRGPKDLLV